MQTSRRVARAVITSSGVVPKPCNIFGLRLDPGEWAINRLNRLVRPR
jgi:hypothetical protein